MEEIEAALQWFGIEACPADCDYGSDGSVWYGLTEILPKGSL